MRAIRLLGILFALGFAGCGGDDEPTDRPESAASGDPKQVFASTCGGCHTLKAAGTSGSIGPNLDELKPDAARVQAALKSGPGAMPENLLTGDDAQQVADYVASNAGG
jgi:mono/diheme cytochrome c family protein